MNIKISNQKPKKEYEVQIGKDTIKNINKSIKLNTYSQVLILTDETITSLGHHLTVIETVKKYNPKTNYIEVPSGEKYKNFEVLQEIITQMIDLKLDRNSLLINLGGGVIGDMGGFAASIYMRGIDFVQIPTTLLSIVDASVGGKVAIDIDNYKNIIGSFSQPVTVIADINMLTTLPFRQFMSGFGEMIKHGLINSKDHFEEVVNFVSNFQKNYKEIESNDEKTNQKNIQNIINTNSNYLEKVITDSVSIKAKIVEQDFLENNVRKTLNFGHTFGHAFESFAMPNSNPLLHGEAVSIGIIAESKLANLEGILSDEDFAKIIHSIKYSGISYSLIDYDWSKLENFDQIIVDTMMVDKKNSNGDIKWSLIETIGSCQYDKICKMENIQKSLEFVKQLQ